MMYDHSLNTVTVQQIQVFLCAADTLNFTQTAQILHMTQPGISKAISSLENTLQLPLFERTGKTVSLTNEGIYLHKKWSSVLSDLQNSYREAKFANEKTGRILNIGICNTTDANLYFWDLLQKFKTKYPDISVNTESEDMKSLEYNLYDKNYDLVFLPDFEQYSLDKTISWKYAAKSNIQIITLLSNPLSRKDMLEITDILDKPVVVIDPEVNPNFIHSLENLYRSYGCIPNCVGFYKSDFHIRYSLNMIDCIHITDNYYSYSPDHISKKIPLKDHFNGIICAWCSSNEKKSLKLFTDMIGIL